MSPVPTKNEDLIPLMRSYQQGDRAAAQTLMEHLMPPLYRFFLAQQATRPYAEDLLQETWLQLHKARHTYRGGEPVLPWVYAIARHVRVDAYRRHARRAAREIGMSELPERTGSDGRDTVAHLAIEPCLERLPQSQRDVVTMLKLTGMSVDEVARALATTAGAVKQKAHRAYATLRRCLEGQS